MLFSSSSLVHFCELRVLHATSARCRHPRNYHPAIVVLASSRAGSFSLPRAAILRVIAIMMAHPRHGECEALLVASLRHPIQPLVGNVERVEAASISGISVVDRAAGVLIEGAHARVLG